MSASSTATKKKTKKPMRQKVMPGILGKHGEKLAKISASMAARRADIRALGEKNAEELDRVHVLLKKAKRRKFINAGLEFEITAGAEKCRVKDVK